MNYELKSAKGLVSVVFLVLWTSSVPSPMIIKRLYYQSSRRDLFGRRVGCVLPPFRDGRVLNPSQIAVVAVMCKPHRCPHIAMTGNICVCAKQRQCYRSGVADIAVVIVLVVPTPILITAPKATRGTNRRVCAPFARGMILTSRHEDAWSN